MNFLFPRASLRRSSRTRKNSISGGIEDECLPTRSVSVSRRKARPPPLQIIPELSENELDKDLLLTSSPATARPTQFSHQQMQPHSSCVTLSAYTFSIDDVLLMFGDDALRSPALSASSSTTGASSEGVPATPGTSDDEDNIIIPITRLRPQCVSVRPLCIAKTRSVVYQEDEDARDCLEKGEEKVIALPLNETEPGVKAEATVVEEAAQDFYAWEFEDFVSLSPVVPFPCSPARRDSFTLVVEALPTVTDSSESKLPGRSRHSKPLPLLPPVTPPLSTFPLMFPLVQTTAHTSVVRRKRNIPPPGPPPLSPPRPLPRMGVPLDIEDSVFPGEDLHILSRGSIVSEYDSKEDSGIYRPPSFPYTPSADTCQFPSAIPATPLPEMWEVALPRSSTDSDAPRSSIDSTSSFASSSTSNTPSPPASPSFECHPEFEDTRCLRSRWSSSTLASVAAEPPRTGTLLSPLRNVLGSRVPRVPLQKVFPQTSPSSKHSKNKRGTPPSAPEKRIRQHRSRSSTSSGGTSSSEGETRDGSPAGLQRKAIPMLMFLRTSS